MLHIKYPICRHFVQWDEKMTANLGCRSTGMWRHVDGERFPTSRWIILRSCCWISKIWQYHPSKHLEPFAQKHIVRCQKYSIVSYTAVRTSNLIRLWNCSRFWEEATMTYCAIISEKFRYCQLVNSDHIPCFFLDVCPMLFLCDGMLRICTLLFREDHTPVQ